MSTPTFFRRTTIDILLTFTRQFLAGLLQLGQVLIVARMLGPEGAGAYAVALLVPTLMSQLLNLGLTSANVYFLASNQFSLPVVWNASRDLLLLMAVLGLLLGAIVITKFGALVLPGVPKMALLIALFIYPLSLIVGVVGGLFQALQCFRAFNTVVLVQPTLSFFAISYLWLYDNINIIEVLLSVFISYALAVVISLVVLKSRTPLFGCSTDRMRYLRCAMVYGGKSHLGNILSFLNYRLDLFLVNLFLGPAQAGVYTVAVRIAEQLWMISQAVSTVIFPKLSAMVQEEAERRAFTPMMARVVLWITILASAVLSAVADPLIKLLFGPDFSDAGTALVILLPGIVLFSCARVLSNDLAARGWVGLNLIVAFFTLTGNVIGNLVLIPFYGIYGASGATTLAYFSVFIAYMILQKHLNGISFQSCVVPQRKDIIKLFGITLKDRK
jgi:O-antigen/teichoic acid export membrane protein